MGFSFGDHVLVISPCPGTVNDRLTRPFDKGLAQETRRLPAPMGPQLLAAFFPHRRHTDQLLQTRGTRMERAQGAEGGAEPRPQRRPGSGQVAEKVRLRMLPEDLFDLFIELGKVAVENAPLIQQKAQLQHGTCSVTSLVVRARA